MMTNFKTDFASGDEFFAGATTDIDKLNGITECVNISLPPIGMPLPWLKTLTNVPALTANWVECNGQVLSDADSPLDGQTIPNLNASGGGTKRFLRGSTTSGTTGGAETATATLPNHQHSIDYGAPGSTGLQTTAHLGMGVVSGVTQSVGSGNAFDNLNSYYEVVWIVRIK